MKYEEHKGNEHVPSSSKVTGKRRRLIPETDTERALLACILSDAEKKSVEVVRKRLYLGGSPPKDRTEEEVDLGWRRAEFTVDTGEPMSFLTDGGVVTGFACVVEHPYRDLDRNNRLEVWFHFPEQEGCGGSTNSVSSGWPVALMDIADKIRESA